MVALDAAGGLLTIFFEPFLALAERLEVMLAPLVAELEHCTFDFAADLETLGVCRFGGNDSFLDCPVKKVCTFLAADLDKGCLSGLVR